MTVRRINSRKVNGNSFSDIFTFSFTWIFNNTTQQVLIPGEIYKGMKVSLFLFFN